jgi:hypothetical protein
LTSYCTIIDVREVLLMTEDDDDADTELGHCVISVSALVDSLLAKHDLTVPSPTPQNIKDACAHFGAWLYRRRRDPVGAKAFEEEGNRFLDSYITTTLATSGIGFRAGEGT